MIHKIAKLSSANPVEIIVLIFCIISLTYFQLVDLVKSSEFLLSPNSIKNSSITFSNGVWSSSSTTKDLTARELWLQQLVIASPIQPSEEFNKIDSSVDRAVKIALTGSDCYSTRKGAQCWIDKGYPSTQLIAHSIAFRSEAASLAFPLNLSTIELAPQGFAMKKLATAVGPQRYMSFFSRKDGVEEIYEGARERSQEEMQSVTWMIFAARAFVMRFYGLIKVISIHFIISIEFC